MGKIIPSFVHEPQLNLNHQEIEQLFLEFGRRKEYASLEGLGTFAGSLAVSFGDFMYRVGANIKSIVTSSLKDVKRSSLEIQIQSHKLEMYLLLNSDYTALMNVKCPVYPFVVKPSIVASYCVNVFKVLEMRKRINNIIEEYLRLNSAIYSKNLSTALDSLAKLSILNANEQDSFKIKEDLKNMVAGHSPKTYTPFGDVFNATSEFKEVIDVVLTCADELEVAASIGRTLDVLYKAYGKLEESIDHVAKEPNTFDLSKIAGISGVVYNTGELIECYAMLVREYHHLEFWLATTAAECAKQKK